METEVEIRPMLAMMDDQGELAIFPFSYYYKFQ